MQVPQQLDEILTLDGGPFGVAFYDYLVAKKNGGASLHPAEEEAWLLLTMPLDIYMEGFVDLFYQLYSLRDCAIVEACLKKLDLHRLAALFAEAKALYTDGRTDLTEEEYHQIDPFGEDDRWQRFDEIAQDVLAAGSELYLIGERVELYIKEQLRK
jgi:hypothetical protein